MVYCFSPVCAKNALWLVYTVYFFDNSMCEEWFVTSVYGILFAFVCAMNGVCNEWFVTSVYSILLAFVCAMNGL